jgi:hypothetical protein
MMFDKRPRQGQSTATLCYCYPQKISVMPTSASAHRTLNPLFHSRIDRHSRQSDPWLKGRMSPKPATEGPFDLRSKGLHTGDVATGTHGAGSTQFGGEGALRRKLADKVDEVAALPEVIQFQRFIDQLDAGSCQLPAGLQSFEEVGMDKTACMAVLTAALATQASHVESRMASVVGEGYYTIGPGGEELLACVGLQLRQTDPMALHYRHLATQFARHLQHRTLDEVLLDRARGHAVSGLDPVAGGVHCSLGGSDFDFMVTSTLASQGPPAVVSCCTSAHWGSGRGGGSRSVRSVFTTQRRPTVSLTRNFMRRAEQWASLSRAISDVANFPRMH